MTCNSQQCSFMRLKCWYFGVFSMNKKLQTSQMPLNGSWLHLEDPPCLLSSLWKSKNAEWNQMKSAVVWIAVASRDGSQKLEFILTIKIKAIDITCSIKTVSIHFTTKLNFQAHDSDHTCQILQSQRHETILLILEMLGC